MSGDLPMRNWADRIRPVWRVANRLESAQLRRFGTSGMSLLRRTSVLVIETTGRRTGRRRSAPVAYWIWDDGNYYVGGGAAGMATVPDWVANLRADPAAAVVVKRRRVSVQAEELAGDAYDDARAHAIALWPGVPKYEQRSGRRVPYFRLRPTADE